ncbi:hypothetical protein H0I76_18780 [Limibaculum sp. M0105]|uniref:Phospholipase/carboxylesterase/thioesterase domain-containing protein n=1 Tax=Thermohalobaculum xanthum TaxID=2753746 RepID=A0A8J7SI96_9RHOB|nr:hypothetical protein [Thermohalobaculum xanthum]MBK0401247.1 hypothetical protein [Thermohalobaculum xanthum]
MTATRKAQTAPALATVRHGLARRGLARRLAASLLLGLATAACGTAEAPPETPPGVTMELSGRANAPLLVVLHGPEGSAARLRHLAAFRLGAEGWSIAWPDAGPRGWMYPAIDQAGRLETLINRLAASALVDPERVVVAGFSDGGQLALTLACNRPDLLAGAAAVMASLPAGAGCEGGQPVPILMMHSTTDPVLPFAGGAVSRPAGLPGGIRLASPVMAADETAALIAHRNRCGAAREVGIPDLAPDDGTRAIARVYEGCAAPVSQFVIDGGGHAWPGTRLATGAEAALGTPARDVSATLEIEAFARESVAQVPDATGG